MRRLEFVHICKNYTQTLKKAVDESWHTHFPIHNLTMFFKHIKFVSIYIFCLLR